MSAPLAFSGEREGGSSVARRSGAGTGPKLKCRKQKLRGWRERRRKGAWWFRGDGMSNPPPNGDSVRVAQASPTVVAVVGKALTEMGAAAGAAGAAAGETLIGASFVYWSASGGVRVASESECCGSQAVVAALGVMGEKLDAVAKGNFELRKDADRLQEENDELRGKMADRFFDFALEVRKDDFWRFAVIMALGNRKAAAKHLKVAQRSFYGQIERWKGEQAQGYRTMLQLMAWRKKAGRCEEDRCRSR